jgi:hypothetical protein
MRPTRALLALVASLAPACGMSSIGPGRSATQPPSIENQTARRLLCPDIGEHACLASCPESLSPRDHADCLLALRFAPDPVALGLARALYARTGTLPGIGGHTNIEGFRGEAVALFPALPIGEHRHHLAWIHDSLEGFDAFVGEIASRAPRLVVFEPRPRAFVFYRTAVPSYPSAYCSEGIIAYNLEGPLHADPRDARETLFHELFHVNDARRGAWSVAALGDVYDSILRRCGEDHECLRPYAPHPSVVVAGTYYAFDPRTRDVREYAAELALRYFLEHEAVLSGASPGAPSFKCLTPENRVAWERITDAFFGGVDLTPSCAAPIES